MSLEIKTIRAVAQAAALLVGAGLSAILAMPVSAEPGAQAPAATPAGASAPVGLAKVVVTGSRIPRSEKEGTTSVTVITSKDIEAKGYRNVFDAISQQTQNTGFTQGADYGNTFTPAANAISLRGLGPNHTLVLVDGRRVADYPVAYDGNVNFVNLAWARAGFASFVAKSNGQPGVAR